VRRANVQPQAKAGVLQEKEDLAQIPFWEARHGAVGSIGDEAAAVAGGAPNVSVSGGGAVAKAANTKESEKRVISDERLAKRTVCLCEPSDSLPGMAQVDPFTL
jgi:hypothetical protein